MLSWKPSGRAIISSGTGEVHYSLAVPATASKPSRFYEVGMCPIWGFDGKNTKDLIQNNICFQARRPEISVSNCVLSQIFSFDAFLNVTPESTGL